MQVTELTSLDPDMDYTQILPIQQKRTIAFINHFVTNTVSFLNHFSKSCESRLMEFEYKLQKVEATLLILESQLASIPHLDEDNITATETKLEVSDDIKLPAVTDENDETDKEDAIKPPPPEESAISQDPRYEKYIKMLKYGTPEGAVRVQMQADGFDPALLDTITKH